MFCPNPNSLDKTCVKLLFQTLPSLVTIWLTLILLFIQLFIYSCTHFLNLIFFLSFFSGFFYSSSSLYWLFLLHLISFGIQSFIIIINHVGVWGILLQINIAEIYCSFYCNLGEARKFVSACSTVTCMVQPSLNKRISIHLFVHSLVNLLVY